MGQRTPLERGATVPRGEARRARLLPALVLAGLLLGAAPLHAQQPPRLLPADHEVRGPSDPLRIRLAGWNADTLARLILELDDVDVTAVLEREGEVLVLRPVEPLAEGVHHLRLVEHTPEGDLLEHGSWTFEIRHSARLREAGLAMEGSVSAVHRLGGSGLGTPPPRRGRIQGAATFDGRAADGDWQVTGEGEVLLDTDPAGLPRGGGLVDAGEFLVTGRRGAWEGRAGHQAPLPPGLLAGDFTRRGLSAGYLGAGGRYAARAFAVTTQEVLGLRQGLGVGSPARRTAGVVFEARPVARDPEALVVAVTLLSGGDPGQTGEGVGGESETGSRGDGVSVAADALLLDRRLRLRGEAAGVRYDFDGGGPAAAERDRALALLAEYAVWRGDTGDGTAPALAVGVEHRRVGTFFRSPANPEAVPDRELLRAFARFNRGGLQLEAALGRETDNVNDLALLPRIRTRRATLALVHAPEPAGEALPWYGRPTFTLEGVDQERRVVRGGAGLAPGPFSATTRVAFSAGFAYPSWEWSLAHFVGRSDDFTGQSAATDDRTTEAAVNIQGEGGASLALSFQHSDSRDRDAAIDDTTDTASLELGYPFGERLTLNLGITLNRQRLSDDSLDTRTLTYTAAAVWDVQGAGAGRPGVQLALEGTRNELSDRVDPAGDATSNQVFLRLTVFWVPGE